MPENPYFQTSVAAMVAASFKWTDPRSWPWIFWVWVAITLASWIKPSWRWLQKRRQQSWPMAQGRIERAEAKTRKWPYPSFAHPTGKDSHSVELSYSYIAGGVTYHGAYRKDCASEEEAEDFVHDLAGRPVLIAFNPQKASSSALGEDALDMLISSRGVLEQTEHLQDLPSWAKPLLWPVVVLSFIGLVLSLWIHLGALAGRAVAPEPFFWAMHAGVFLVWFPAVFAAKWRTERAGRKRQWNALFKDAPALKYVVYAFGAYAFINFWISSSQASAQSKEGPISVAQWRDFSATWMGFYAAGLTILLSGLFSQSESRVLPPKQPKG